MKPTRLSTLERCQSALHVVVGGAHMLASADPAINTDAVQATFQAWTKSVSPATLILLLADAALAVTELEIDKEKTNG